MSQHLPTLLITGGSQALVTAVAMKAAGHYHLLFSGQEDTFASNLCQQLHSNNHEALHLDNGSHSEPVYSRQLERIDRRFGGLDMLLILPDTVTAGPLEALSSHHWDTHFRAHVNPIAALLSHCTERMKKAAKGTIVLGSHQYHRLHLHHMAAQAAQDAALCALVDTLKADFQGIEHLHASVFPLPLHNGETLNGVDPLSRARLSRAAANADTVIDDIAEGLLRTLREPQKRHTLSASFRWPWSKNHGI